MNLLRALALLPLLPLLATAASAAAQTPAPRSYLTESAAERDARMAWWREARFGMFIHWGPYAVPAGTHRGERVRGIGEWIMNDARIPVAEYEEYARRFDPRRFDADAWVRVAKEAGMKYIVLTSKHHDGFALWDSRVSRYDLVDGSPYGRDAIRQLADAARREGLRLGFYYSIMDWHHPYAQAPNAPAYNTRDPARANPLFDRYVEEYMKPQLRELLTQYGDVAVLWFDGEWIPEWTEEKGRELYDFVRAIQPDILVNNRVGKGRQGMRGLTTEGHVGDFGTPEQEIPAQGLPGIDWESCMTMNDTWGYKSYDDHWKDTRTLVRNLVDIASKGGNFLLNVGPTAEGLIPEPSVSRLREIGEWMRVNAESVHGTTPAPFATQPSWGRYTRRPGRLYAHVFEWPRDGRLVLAEVKERPGRVFLLADGTPLEFVSSPGGLSVQLPAVPPSTIDAVLVVESL